MTQTDLAMIQEPRNNTSGLGQFCGREVGIYLVSKACQGVRPEL